MSRSPLLAEGLFVALEKIITIPAQPEVAKYDPELRFQRGNLAPMMAEGAAEQGQDGEEDQIAAEEGRRRFNGIKIQNAAADSGIEAHARHQFAAEDRPEPIFLKPGDCPLVCVPGDNFS